jgi:hypothetical protein
MKAKLFLAAGIGLFLAAPAMFAGASLADRRLGKTVLPIAAHEPDVVERNRSNWKKGQPVADLYGVPAPHGARLLDPDPRDLFVPPEDPSLMLYRPGPDSRTTHAHSVYFAAKMAGAACVPLALLCLVGWGVFRKA